MGINSTSINEFGNRYGRLVVTYKTNPFKKGNKTLSQWICICDCGNECTVKGTDLRTGHTKSCGCLKRETAVENCVRSTKNRKGLPADNRVNEIGTRYGKLVVIDTLPTQHRKARWLCQCDCGKRKKATGDSLRSGKVQSCGCLRNNLKEQAESPALKYKNKPDSIYKEYIRNASNRGIDFRLSIEEFSELLSKPCWYCGDRFSRMGVDRVDNFVGYMLSNAVTCCVQCNRMKLTYTVEQFIERCTKVVNHKKATTGAISG